MLESVARPLRKPATPFKPVVDPTAWSKEDLAHSDDWVFPLSEQEIADLDRAVADIERRRLPLMVFLCETRPSRLA